MQPSIVVFGMAHPNITKDEIDSCEGYYDDQTSLHWNLKLLTGWRKNMWTSSVLYQVLPD